MKFRFVIDVPEWNRYHIVVDCDSIDEAREEALDSVLDGTYDDSEIGVASIDAPIEPIVHEPGEEIVWDEDIHS